MLIIGVMDVESVAAISEAVTSDDDSDFNRLKAWARSVNMVSRCARVLEIAEIEAFVSSLVSLTADWILLALV